MEKCKGCGIVLQNQDSNQIGYTRNIEHDLCERCFRIRNYSDYKVTVKDNQDYIEILKKIDQTKDLVVLVIDIFLLNQELVRLSELLHNPILLVLTKRDVLPLRVADEKLLHYMNQYHLNIVDEVVISSTKNYHFDELYTKIKKHQVSKNVYVVGFTNAGKSTMINQMLYHYSNENTVLTTSLMPSTTLDQIFVYFDDTLTLIDTPGLLVPKSLMNQVSGKELKRILPKKEIKPITYQIKKKQRIFIDDFVSFDIDEGNDITIYMSNQLCIQRTYALDQRENMRKISVLNDEDVVFEGLGFIHVKKATTLNVYTNYDMLIYTRKKLI